MTGKVAHTHPELVPQPGSEQTFPREYRLLSGRDFQRVFDQPLVSQDRYFRILARPNDLLRPRLGLAISKRMDRRASARNRIKRVLRESFRLNAGQLLRDQRWALDVVAIGRHAAPRAGNQELFESLTGHWRRLNKKAQDQQ